jgi:uncharacterized protein YcfJ
MNANRKLIDVSTIAAAVAALAVAFPAVADDHRGSRRGERPAVMARHAPPPAVRHADYRRAQPQRVVVERRLHRQPPVVHQRPVVVHRTVVVRRPVVMHRPVVVERRSPVYYAEPAPVYYGQPATYHDDEHNPAGAIAGAVIGGVIGSQVGDHDSRGITTVIGAIFGGLIGSNF